MKEREGCKEKDKQKLIKNQKEMEKEGYMDKYKSIKYCTYYFILLDFFRNYSFMIN